MLEQSCLLELTNGLHLSMLLNWITT